MKPSHFEDTDHKHKEGEECMICQNNDDGLAMERLAKYKNMSTREERKSNVDVDTNYDNLNLNKNAEGFEHSFERSFENISKHDPTFNDPKNVLQYRDRAGIENISGRTFDPLIQGDPGELENLKENAEERVKNDSVDYRKQNEEGTKPIHHDKRTTDIFNASNYINLIFLDPRTS